MTIAPNTSWADDVFNLGGAMGQHMRSMDWSAMAFGPVEDWPQSLRTALSICLTSRFPILLWWGDTLSVLYNDAYIPIFANKHPWVLGRTGREAWARCGMSSDRCSSAS